MTARDHVPLRSRSSSRSAFSIASYAHRLTKRDFEILVELYEHRVLTTPHIHELHFDTHTRASKRMLQLYRLGRVERFRPHTPTGSAPWHYTLDEPGARLVAARQEIDFKDFTFKKARIFDVVGSPRLRHRVECNGFFARLTLACRRRGWKLVWIGERRAAARWYSHIYPDGIGHLMAGDREISFFLEYDRGTENHDQLETKMSRYRLVGRTVSSEDALLFVFPRAARERYARRALIGASVPGATAVRADALRHPVGPVWLPLPDDRRRPILDLPRLPRDMPGRPEVGSSTVPRRRQLATGERARIGHLLPIGSSDRATRRARATRSPAAGSRTSHYETGRRSGRESATSTGLPQC